LTKSRKIGAESAIAQQKTRPKIGRELINQGASTYLISGSTLPLSGQFDKISENWCRKCDRPKKTRPKIGRELINQGASTYLISASTPPLSGQF
jgi:hypothetical protein